MVHSTNFLLIVVYILFVLVLLFVVRIFSIYILRTKLLLHSDILSLLLRTSSSVMRLVCFCSLVEILVMAVTFWVCAQSLRVVVVLTGAGSTAVVALVLALLLVRVPSLMGVSNLIRVSALGRIVSAWWLALVGSSSLASAKGPGRYRLLLYRWIQKLHET
jgi:hypothetical protein